MTSVLGSISAKESILHGSVMRTRVWKRECSWESSALFQRQLLLFAKSYLTLCDPMDCSMPGSSVHSLLELAQIHVHWVGDAIQPSHLLPPTSFDFNLSQHQGLFQRDGPSHQGAKVLELQLQHQSFQWIYRLISFQRQGWYEISPHTGKFLDR